MEKDVLEDIYRRFCKTGDISYRESDIVFHAAQKLFSGKLCDLQKDIITEWYERVYIKTLNNKFGVFVHTVPLGSIDDFKNSVKDSLAYCLDETNLILKKKRKTVNLVVLRNKDQLGIFGDVPKTLAKRPDHTDNKAVYRFLRADTLRRFGNLVRINLDGIKKHELDIACVYRYEMEEKNCNVDRPAQVYAAVFLELENMGIKFLTCNDRADCLYNRFSDFSVFVDEKEAERVDIVLKTAEHIESLKGILREIPEQDIYLFSLKGSGLKMNDPEFRRSVKMHVMQFFPEKEAEEDEWLDVIR